MGDRVCWSAGHGKDSQGVGTGIDSGATSAYGQEWAKVQGLAARLAADTAALAIPTLFRDTGPFWTADDAGAKFGARMFTEIHLNAAGAAAHGVEALVAPGSTAGERRLAAGYCAAVARVLDIPNRGVKVRSDLAVLHEWPGMESVLLEVAFLTNKTDMARYEARIDRLELALVNAYLSWRGRRPATVLPRKTTTGKLRVRRYLKRI